jgi:hypothetical protein
MVRADCNLYGITPYMVILVKYPVFRKIGKKVLGKVFS